MRLTEVKTEPEIIVMVGLPGSGKSTWRDAMLAKSDREYVIISSDDEIEALAAEAGTTYSAGFKQFIGKATAISKQKFREAVNKGRNILWDQTNLNPKKRKSILSQVPEEYTKTAVVFNITAHELQQRLDKREKETGKFIPPNVMKDMARSYRPPTKEEGFDTVSFV